LHHTSPALGSTLLSGDPALIIGIGQDEESLGNVATGLCARPDTANGFGAAGNEAGNRGMAKTTAREICQQLPDTAVWERCPGHIYFLAKLWPRNANEIYLKLYDMVGRQRWKYGD
jgi:hypothetical protein